MEAGYTVDINYALPTKDTTHILVYNWSAINLVAFPAYSFDSDEEIEERPALHSLVAVFKIKYKNSNHVQHS